MAENQALEAPVDETEAAATQPTPIVPTSSHRIAASTFRRLWLASCALFGLQGAVLIAWSRHLWDRFDLTVDFAAFNQAWSQIGSGHLNPYDTTVMHGYPHWGYPFLQDHFAIAMWPLALLHLVTSSAFALLVAQDLALCAIGAVAFRTGLELLESRWGGSPRSAIAVAVALLMALGVDPWVYWSASYDFHLQPFAVLFLVLAMRDLWRGRKRMWLWVAAMLACGDVAASYLLGIGLAALCSRESRIRGVAMGAIGLGWIALADVIGADKGSNVVTHYAYLAGMHSGAAGFGASLAIGWGVLLHPSTARHIFQQRFSDIYKFMASTGTIGFLSPIGFSMWLVVLVPNALTDSPNFIQAFAAFQSLAFVVAGILGLTVALAWISARGRWGPKVSLALAGAAVAQMCFVAVQWLPQIPPTLAKNDATTAIEADRALALVPKNAEVISSNGVIGRFSNRRVVYPLNIAAGGLAVPVVAGTVAFVFEPYHGIEVSTPGQTEEAIAMVRDKLHARALVSSPSLSAYIWKPPAGVNRLIFAS